MAGGRRSGTGSWTIAGRRVITFLVFQTLILLVPSTTATLAICIGLAGVVIGCVLWLAGARFSRTIIALLAVLIGGIIGMKMPAWCGWSVDSMGTAVAGAMLVGFIGFALHRLWVGVGLGAVLACWTALAGAEIKHIKLDWTLPIIDKTTTLPDYAQLVWNTLPVEFAHIVIISACVSLITGIVLSAVTPRLSVLLLWSWAGVSIASISIAVLLQSCCPTIMRRMPQSQWVQAAILAGLVVVGMLLQLRLWSSMRHVAAKKPAKPKKDPATTQSDK